MLLFTDFMKPVKSGDKALALMSKEEVEQLTKELDYLLCFKNSRMILKLAKPKFDMSIKLKEILMEQFEKEDPK